MRTIDHWINGSAVPSASGRTGPVYNPASGEQQAEVGLASVAEVDAAVAAAAAATVRFWWRLCCSSSRNMHNSTYVVRAAWPDGIPIRPPYGPPQLKMSQSRAITWPLSSTPARMSMSAAGLK